MMLGTCPSRTPPGPPPGGYTSARPRPVSYSISDPSEQPHARGPRALVASW